MKKLVLSAAVLAMVLAAVAPAAAQVFQEGGVVQQVGEQEAESGDVDTSSNVANEVGDEALQDGATGEVVEASEAPAVEVAPALVPAAPAPPAPAPEVKVEAKAPEPSVAEVKAGEVVAKAEAKAEVPKVEVKAEEKKAEAPKAEVKVEQKVAEKKEEKKELPKTGGGGASLFALGTGVVLIGGGLLVRRLVK